MFQPRSIQSSLTIQEKILALDFILVFRKFWLLEDVFDFSDLIMLTTLFEAFVTLSEIDDIFSLALQANNVKNKNITT